MDKHQQTEKDKNEMQPQTTGTTQDENTDEGVVYVVNDDGTPFDTSDRTYVSVDMPEEETKNTTTSDGESAG